MVRHYIMSGVPYSSVPILTATPGIVKESQAVVVDENKDITGFKDITATGDITGANITTILTNIGDRAQELIDAGLDAVFPFTASSPCDTVWATLLFTWQRLIQLNVSLDAIDSTYSDGNNSNIGIGVTNDNATEKLHVVGNIQADGLRIGGTIVPLNESALSNLLRKPARYVNTTKTDVNFSSSFNVFDKWKNDSTALGIGDTTANCVVSFGPDNNTSGHVTSFKVLINGYYRFTNTMCYSLPNTTVSTALNIKTRFSMSSSGTTSSSWNNFGPQGASAYMLDGHSHNTSSCTISDIRYCTVGDYIGVQFAKEANSGTVTCANNLSNFTAELLHAGPV